MEHSQVDNIMLSLCIHIVSRILDAIIKIGKQMQNNGRNRYVADPLEIMSIVYLTFNATLLSSMKQKTLLKNSSQSVRCLYFYLKLVGVTLNIFHSVKSFVAQNTST